jgi:hypothetical protein
MEALALVKKHGGEDANVLDLWSCSLSFLPPPKSPRSTGADFPFDDPVSEASPSPSRPGPRRSVSGNKLRKILGLESGSNDSTPMSSARSQSSSHSLSTQSSGSSDAGGGRGRTWGDRESSSIAKAQFNTLHNMILDRDRKLISMQTDLSKVLEAKDKLEKEVIAVHEELKEKSQVVARLENKLDSIETLLKTLADRMQK